MAIPVVGFDIGNSTSFIAIARSGGIETIDNEYSDRCTPTFISFGEKNRAMGASAKEQAISNMKSTLFNFPRMVGKKFSDPALQKELVHCPFTVIQTENDGVGIEVSYLNEKMVITPEQAYAVQLTKLKEITMRHLTGQVYDVVINVPSYFADSERRAVLDSARISGLNCVRLVNDTTAVGIAYGIYNKDLPATGQPARNVAFVLMGQSNLQVAICAFNNGKMKVLSAASDPFLGGRDFDKVIFDYMCKEFASKYKIDVKKSPKACVRLYRECEKLKKLMSANSTKLSLNIECFMEDKDVSGFMQRSDFEALIGDEISRAQNVMEKCLVESKLDLKDLSFVELVGGSTRVPIIKQIVNKVFGQEGRTTLNADEAVARGCAFQAAMCSPTFKVKEFVVSDVCLYPITLFWESDGTKSQEVVDEGEIKCDGNSVELFPYLYSVPASRQVPLQRKGDFDVQAQYTDVGKMNIKNPIIGNFRITGVQLAAGVDSVTVRIKVRVNGHGIFAITNAQLGEKVEKEVESPKPMDVDQGKTEGDEKAQKEAPETLVEPKKVTKIVTKWRDLHVQSETTHYPEDYLTICIEKENEMVQKDKLERNRSNAKNALEEYIYEMRDKLCDSLVDYVLEADREKFKQELTAHEDWLYDEGEDVACQPYVDKLNFLKSFGDVFMNRLFEAEMRPAAMSRFEAVLLAVKNFIDAYSSKPDDFAHITPEEVSQVSTNYSEKKDWFQQQMALQNSRAKTDDPVISFRDIESQANNLHAITAPIINKPKPVVKPPPETKENGEKEDNNNTSKKDPNCTNEQPTDKQSGDVEKSPEEVECMDLD
uniref:Heat shock protein 105 n=1 Tax=Neobenedenia melleni TaxID=280695 RepID=F8J4A1_9PLAT|nr:heat shock protein 105 [Neobenedenia melleni]